MKPQTLPPSPPLLLSPRMMIMMMIMMIFAVGLSAMLKPWTKASSSPSHQGGSDEFPSSLADCSRRMFQRQDGCDVMFVVKCPGDSTETKIGAHRYVLASRSPYFHKLTQWGGRANADRMKLKVNDIPADVFREILRSVSFLAYTKPLQLTQLCSHWAVNVEPATSTTPLRNDELSAVSFRRQLKTELYIRAYYSH